MEDKKLTSLCDDCAHKIDCKNIDILKSVICSLRSAQVGESTPEGKIEVIKVRDIPWISLHLNCKNFMVDATSIYDKEMIL